MSMLHSFGVGFLLLCGVVSCLRLPLEKPSSEERRSAYRNQKGIQLLGPYVRGLSVGDPSQKLSRIMLTTTSADLLIFSTRFTNSNWAFNETLSKTFQFMNFTYSNFSATNDGAAQRLYGNVAMEYFSFSHENPLFQNYIVYFALIDGTDSHTETYPGHMISGVLGLGFSNQASPHMDVAAAAFLNDANYSRGATLNYFSCIKNNVVQDVGIFSIQSSIDEQHCDVSTYVEAPIVYAQQWSLAIEHVSIGSYQTTRPTIALINIAQLVLGVPSDLYFSLLKDLRIQDHSPFPAVDCDEAFPPLVLRLANSTVTFGEAAYVDRVSPTECRLVAYPVNGGGFRHSWVLGYTVLVEKCVFLGWDAQVVGLADAKTSCSEVVY